jgi:hypothetical protein
VSGVEGGGQEGVLGGGCLCGAVRFAIERPLLSASWCHCRRCQRRSGGAASVQGRLEPGSLRLLQGAELVATYWPADGYGKAFCSSCGSQLWSVNPETRAPSGVRLGVIDGDPGVRPSYHQFVAYAAPWQPLPDDGLPRYPERRPV